MLARRPNQPIHPLYSTDINKCESKKNCQLEDNQMCKSKSKYDKVCTMIKFNVAKWARKFLDNKNTADNAKNSHNHISAETRWHTWHY